MTGSLFSYVDLEERIPARHPLRKIRTIVNDALRSLDSDFDGLYAGEGRPSIAPERLIRASLVQILYPIRSERQAGGGGSRPSLRALCCSSSWSSSVTGWRRFLCSRWWRS